MTSLFRPFLVGAALLALALCGCGSSAASHNDADVAFATDMVPHHRQAVQMSDVLLTKSGVDPDVVALATTIRAEQAPEIEQMTGWLITWGAPAQPGGTVGMDGMGGGMMSPEDMESLASAQGPTAQALFLKGMVGQERALVREREARVGLGADLVQAARPAPVTVVHVHGRSVGQGAPAR